MPNSLAYSSVGGIPLRPAAALAATFPRAGAQLATSALLVSQRLHLVAIDIPAGTTITSITFVSGTTAAGTPLNQWFALYSSGLVLRRQTADDTTTAWAASVAKTLALTSAYTTTSTGLHYLGIMVNATTVPALAACNGLSQVHALAPVINGFSSTGLTTTAPDPAAALAAQANAPWAFVS